MPHINTRWEIKEVRFLSLSKKTSNFLMLKMCLSGCSFCALLWRYILFPEDVKYWLSGIIPFNKHVFDFYQIQAVCSVLWTWRTIKWFSRQSEMVERKYAFTRFMAENDFSLNDKENFFQHNDLGHKSLGCCT